MNNNLLCDIQKQLNEVYEKYGMYASFHEAMSVLREEFEELWTECKQKELNYENIKAEIIDNIVVLLKMYEDVCINKVDEKRKR